MYRNLSLSVYNPGQLIKAWAYKWGNKIITAESCYVDVLVHCAVKPPSIR